MIVPKHFVFMFWAVVFSLFNNHFPLAFLNPPLVLHSFLRPTHGERKGQMEGHSGISMGWREDRNNTLWKRARWQGIKGRSRRGFPLQMSVMRNKDQIYDPWSSREDGTVWTVDYGFYSFRFNVDRIAPMGVRGIVFKHRANPVPGLTALPSFGDKGPTLQRAGPMCLNILCSHQLPLYFCFPTPYSSYYLLPQSFSLHMPPLAWNALASSR